MARARVDSVTHIERAWARERPDVDISSIGVITPLWRVASLVMANRERTLAVHGLDQSALDLLGTLRRAGPPYRLTAGELAVRCQVTPGAITQRVARLESLGMVERAREDADRRTVYVQLRLEGRTRLDDIFADVMSSDDAMLESLSPRDRASLQRILRAWLAHLESAQN